MISPAIVYPINLIRKSSILDFQGVCFTYALEFDRRFGFLLKVFSLSSCSHDYVALSSLAARPREFLAGYPSGLCSR